MSELYMSGNLGGAVVIGLLVILIFAVAYLTERHNRNKEMDKRWATYVDRSSPDE